MHKPLISRLEKLELSAEQAMPSNRNLHIIREIVNPDRSVHHTFETIIENGVVIRDDCVRPLV